MFLRKLKENLKNSIEKMPKKSEKELASSEYVNFSGDLAGRLKAFRSKLEIADYDGRVEVIEWADLANVRWDQQESELTFRFVDPKISDFKLKLSAECSELFVDVVRERIESSVVFQLFDTLPSGVAVQGQVRRNVNGTLFTQIITDNEIGETDFKAMTTFESELRQAVGL